MIMTYHKPHTPFINEPHPGCLLVNHQYEIVAIGQYVPRWLGLSQTELLKQKLTTILPRLAGYERHLYQLLCDPSKSIRLEKINQIGPCADPTQLFDLDLQQDVSGYLRVTITPSVRVEEPYQAYERLSNGLSAVVGRRLNRFSSMQQWTVGAFMAQVAEFPEPATELIKATESLSLFNRPQQPIRETVFAPPLPIAA